LKYHESEDNVLLGLSNVRIVLVNTSHPGNIGATARAMKNMRLSRLVLVEPRDYPSMKALARAASALDVLDNAVIVPTLADAVADCGLVIGTSARSRKIPWPMLEPEECADRVIREMVSNQVALVFGREDSGLTNEELQLCHYHVQIPGNPEYSVLNLAAAVMVLCYEIHKAALKASTTPRVADDEAEQEMATAGELQGFIEHLERALIRLDFMDPEHPGLLMRKLRRLYTRLRLEKLEVRMLRGILTATEQALDKSDKTSR
jgi:tRNA (cytidine32/uridine32-2'-O)-methyltransferase